MIEDERAATWLGSLSQPDLWVGDTIDKFHALANAARDYDWPAVLKAVRSDQEVVNAYRPGGKAWFAPLHQAAHGGAPLEVVEELIALGAWRGLRTAVNERPVDIAVRLRRDHLIDALTPANQRDVPLDAVSAVEEHFHQVIQGRINHLPGAHGLRLPPLEPLLDSNEPRMWFPVPGMYGGFSYWWGTTGSDPVLVSESWCRVVGGSGERHEVTVRGGLLVASAIDL